MLARGDEAAGVIAVLRSVHAEGGISRLFSGVGPRVLWIGLGGAVFLGGYEAAKHWLEPHSLHEVDCQQR